VTPAHRRGAAFAKG